MLNNSNITERIINSFNTWKFKREQPSSLIKLEQVINYSVEKFQPIQFIAYWGKGDKVQAGEPEKKALKFLDEFFARIKSLYQPGVELLLILTDTHAELNGYPRDEIDEYFASVQNMAIAYGFKIVLLSQIAKLNKYSLLNQLNKIAINPPLLNMLKESAKKHYKGADYIEGAKIYYLQNQLEKQVLNEKYKDFIFLTFNGSDLNYLFPQNLPIFYMYSLKKGSSIKPWFEDV